MKVNYIYKNMELFKNRLLLLLLLILPIISLFLGFISDEDLSTGGTEWDFNFWPVVEFYKFNFYKCE